MRVLVAMTAAAPLVSTRDARASSARNRDTDKEKFVAIRTVYRRTIDHSSDNTVSTVVLGLRHQHLQCREVALDDCCHNDSDACSHPSGSIRFRHRQCGVALPSALRTKP